MYAILEKIKSHFYTRAIGIRPIDDFFSYKTDKEYGVGIININDVKINESFANVKIENIELLHRDEPLNLIVLTSTVMTHKSEFAYFCAQFVDRGKDNKNRDLLTNDPLKWWNNLKELIGNKMYNPETYHIIAELLTLEKLHREKKEDIIWKGPVGSSIDVQTKYENYEVKSSLVRYENEITISSQYQLPEEDEKRYLVFYKLEKMVGGESINTIMERLEKIPFVNIADIEKKLTSLGQIKHRGSRDISYVVHEIRKYIVDDKFPKITVESFKNNQIPHNVKKIIYVINLDNIEYEYWDGETSD